MNIAPKIVISLLLPVGAALGSPSFDDTSIFSRIYNLASSSVLGQQVEETIELTKFRIDILRYEDETLIEMSDILDGSSRAQYEDTLQGLKIKILDEEVARRGIQLKTVGGQIARLKAALAKARSAPDFFRVFRESAAANPRPSDAFRGALDRFVGHHIDKIMALRPSFEDVQSLIGYIEKENSAVLLINRYIKQGFEQVLTNSRSASDFFNVFDALATRMPEPHNLIRVSLDEFFVDNASSLFFLNPPPSVDHIRGVNRYVRLANTNVALLEQVLKKSRNAADFFLVFNRFMRSIPKPSPKYRDALEEFFIAHADAFIALGPEPDHIQRLNSYVARESVVTALRSAAVRRYGNASHAACRRLFDRLF